MRKQVLIGSLVIGLIAATQVEAQVSVLGNNGSSGNYVGWNNAQAFPLQIRHNANQPINFFTNNTQRATISSAGNVGIGLTAPAYLFDVRNGDINTGNGTTASPQGYRIGGNFVLRHKGAVSNIFVGVGAGNANTSGVANTFVGNGTGFNTTTGVRNTFVGYQAGFTNTTGGHNTFAGYGAGFSNTTGGQNTYVGYLAGLSNTTGYRNTFVGDSAGYSNTTGRWNTFVGFVAGTLNVSGQGNTFVGDSAGYNNTLNYNTFAGYRCGVYNTTGFSNSFYGKEAGYRNTTGQRNTFLGNHASYGNTVGNANVAIGDMASYGGKFGNENVAIGTIAGYNNGVFAADDYNVFIGSNSAYDTRGDYNVVIGAFANTLQGLDNTMALGYSANVTASNQVRVGNPSVSSIGGYAGWTNLSDGRFKGNVKENVPGLEFITKLRPVTYHLDMDNIARFLNTPDSLRMKDAEAAKGAMLQTGFIAQEVEEAAREAGYDFSGVDRPKNEHDFYGLRYAEFTVPLVKAVQELNEQNAELKKMVEEQQKQIDEMRGDLTVCCNADDLRSETKDNALREGSISVRQIEAIAQDLPLLSQNQPNPFSETTIIRFYLPKGTKSASIKVFDNSGSVHRLFALNGEGPGTIEIEGNTLAPGAYYYSLLVDRNVIDTKTMVLTR